MKRTGLSLVFLASFFISQSQTGSLMLRSSNKGKYVEHKVTAKENFYSIGRLFNVHPKHLATFNGIDMYKGLSTGQVIKIPLSDTNYSHKLEAGTPVYYVTGASETVYNVSTNNNVLMEKLRKWNQVPSDKLPAGTKLIVGYLITPSAQATAINTAIKSTPVSKDVVKNDSVNKTDIKKVETRKPDTKQKDDPAKSTDKTVKKEKKPARDSTVTPGSNTQFIASADEGFFKGSFEQQVKQQPLTKDETVTSGIFKTSSGWDDAKYYLLMDGAEPGTIVRIINPSNNRKIYAKLLGEMTDLKQNQGLNIRISNAAAAALDIPETDKFIVKLNY